VATFCGLCNGATWLASVVSWYYGRPVMVGSSTKATGVGSGVVPVVVVR